MKAYLEIELPESCITCKLALHRDSLYYIFCAGLRNQITRQKKKRHGKCPLIIKGVCAACNKKDGCDCSGGSVVGCECWELR